MQKRKRRMYLFYVPALFIMAVFNIIPFFETFAISLCRWNGYSASKSFIGIKNYLAIFSDSRFLIAFINTLIYGFVSTLLQNLIGLSSAFFVNSRFRGNSVVRVVIYLPIIISGLIMGYIMYFFFTYDRGVLNEILGWFGREPINWLANGKIGVTAITLLNSWQYAGNCMIIYLAGLQNIPAVYVEAAAIDGASRGQRLVHITLPLLIPAITTSVIINLIGGLKLFDPIMSLTNGGPNYQTHSLMTYLNSQYFLKEKAGYASAIGIVTFLLIMIVAVAANKYFEKKMIDV